MESDPGKGSVSGNNSAVVSRPRDSMGQREASVRRIEYVRPAEVTTLGADPLVSSASVIHELSFGRLSADFTGSMSGRDYPIPREEIPHILDLFV